jgi:hypothetical protein
MILAYALILRWKSIGFYRLFLPLTIVGFFNLFPFIFFRYSEIGLIINSISEFVFVILEYSILLYCLSRIITQRTLSIIAKYTAIAVFVTSITLLIVNPRFLKLNAFEITTFHSTSLIILALFAFSQYLLNDDPNKVDSSSFYLITAIFFLHTFIYPTVSIGILTNVHSVPLAHFLSNIIYDLAYVSFYILIIKAIKCKKYQN